MFKFPNQQNCLLQIINVILKDLKSFFLNCKIAKKIKEKKLPDNKHQFSTLYKELEKITQGLSLKQFDMRQM